MPAVERGLGLVERVVRRHVAKLEEVGWCERMPAIRGDGMLVWMTPSGLDGVGLGELIDAVLELSRLSRRRTVRTRVDLSALASEIVAELQSAEPDRPVEIEIQDGLVAEADLALVRSVLRNLLANAYKFTSHTPHPRVHLKAVEGSGVPVYFVADNGAGFEMAHAKGLFLLFHRLHRDSEFPGEGIGLATVVRAVHRHGGVIWAHGAVLHGATFYFSLMHGAHPPADAATGEDVIPAWQPTNLR
jgi:light-regulated signal transduction histidine kinase (bacteriophytochrome)